MSSTDVLDLDVEKRVPPQEAVRIGYGTRNLLLARVLAGVLALPFVIVVITRTGGLGGFIALLIALCGGAYLLHVHRRIAARPEPILVDPEGLSVVRDGRPVRLRWPEIVSVTHHRVRSCVTVSTALDPEALTFDDDLEDFGGFLDLVGLHLDASRRDGAPRHARSQAVFDRPAYEDIATLLLSILGVVAGLLVRPGLFVLTALGLPRLIWHWLTAPTRLVVDGTAVWIVRPLSRDVIPIRAIRDLELGVAGRPAGLAVMIDHRDRGPIVVTGFNASALPFFDAVTGACARAREAARSGASPRHAAAAIGRDSSSRAGALQAAAVLLGFVAIAWVTILTGVPLRTATEHGSDIVARTALLFGAPLDAADGDGLTALHHAASRNRTGIARAIIARGANLDARSTPNRFTPLHKAAERGNAAVAELLIAAGADVDARSTPGRTPLAQASLAFTSGDTDVPRLLLEAGADPDIADGAGRTALHHAARNGHIAQLRLLVLAGANLSARDTLGYTPLHLAWMGKHQVAMAALIDAGADVNAPGWAGRNVLTVAAADTAATAALINMLIDAGARADQPGEDGWNAVQRAARRNNLTVLEVFARRRVPLNATDGRVAPALWIAIDNGNTEAARILLRGGASPRVRWQGRTALEYAQAKRNATLVALMQMR